jgi:hypothetical protein
MTTLTTASARQRTVVGRIPSGQPRTYRLAPPASRHAAYRRLAVAILRLDPATLVYELQSARRAVAHTTTAAYGRLVRAA